MVLPGTDRLRGRLSHSAVAISQSRVKNAGLLDIANWRFSDRGPIKRFGMTIRSSRQVMRLARRPTTGIHRDDGVIGSHSPTNPVRDS